MWFLQSSEALEFLKRDLAEFSTVVQHDTTCSIVATATAVKNKLAVTISVSPSYCSSMCHFIWVDTHHVVVLVPGSLHLTNDLTKPVCVWQVEGSSETTEKVKKSLSSFLGVITDTLAPPPDKTIDCDVITLVATPAGTTEVYDSSKVGSSSTLWVVPPQYRYTRKQVFWESYPCCFFSSFAWRPFMRKVKRSLRTLWSDKWNEREHCSVTRLGTNQTKNSEYLKANLTWSPQFHALDVLYFSVIYPHFMCLLFCSIESIVSKFYKRVKPVSACRQSNCSHIA